MAIRQKIYGRLWNLLISLQQCWFGKKPDLSDQRERFLKRIRLMKGKMK